MLLGERKSGEGLVKSQLDMLKDPKALVRSATDDKWVVRAAVVDAIARRNDPDLLGAVVPLLTDKNEMVRYGAAAAVIRLNAIKAKKR